MFLQAYLEEKLALARYAAALLRAVPNVVVLEGSPQLSIVAFRIALPANGSANEEAETITRQNALNAAVNKRICARQRIFISPTSLPAVNEAGEGVCVVCARACIVCVRRLNMHWFVLAEVSVVTLRLAILCYRSHRAVIERAVGEVATVSALFLDAIEADSFDFSLYGGTHAH